MDNQFIKNGLIMYKINPKSISLPKSSNTYSMKNY